MSHDSRDELARGLRFNDVVPVVPNDELSD
jgi:hypothetical protein